MKKLVLIGVPLVCVLLLGASFAVVQGTPEFTDASAPGWSRGKLVGHASLVNPVALLPEPQGGAHLLWVVGDLSKNQQLNYAHVSDGGDVVFSQPLALPQARPESPTLFRDLDGTLQLLYLAQSPALAVLQRALYAARLTSDGRVAQSFMVSAENEPVKTYSAFQNGGSVGVFYSGDDAAPGLRAACIENGQLTTTCAWKDFAQNGREAGTRPNAQLDASKRLHLSWFQHPARGVNFLLNRTELYYASSDNPQPLKLTEFEYDAGVEVKPPQLVVDPTNLYIAWVLDKRGGESGTWSHAFYVSFPAGKPTTFDEPTPLSLPATAKVKYEPQPGILPALAAARGPASEHVNDLQMLRGQQPQAAGAALLNLSDKGRAPVQVATFALSQGKLAGFQVVNESLARSNQPSIALDGSQHLQLAWMDSEGGDQFAVRYASTDPQLVSRWGQLNTRDVLARVSNFVWYELSFLPWVILTVPWLFLSLALLIVKTVIGSDETMAGRGSRIALALAIAVHLAVKLVLLPPLPAEWGLPLQIAFMAALLAFALLAMWVYLRRTSPASPIVAYLVFALVDVFTALFVWMPLAA